MNNESILDVIIQVRCNSRRFYQKMLCQIGNNQSPLEIQISRIYDIKEIRKIVIATSNLASDQPIEDIYNKLVLKYPFRSQREF